MIAEGDAFLLPLPTNSGIKHLYVVISNPSLDHNNVVIVNLSTWQEGEDDACFLSAEEWGGKYPFIEHDSYVRYRSARLVTAARIEGWLTKASHLGRTTRAPSY